MKLIFCATLIFSFAYSAMAQNKGDEAVAVIGNKKITVDDFNRRYNDVKAVTVNPPTKKQFLEDLVRFEIGVQEAEKKKLDQDPIVKERMRQELYKSFLEKELADKVNKISEITTKEMEDYYKRNPELKTSHILIEFKPGATAEQKAEAKKRAVEIYDEVRKSKRPFEELARLYSDDPISKNTGGDVGWQNRLSLVPSYYEAALSMKVGEVKGLVETQFGYHIIKLTGRHSFENANKRTLRSAVFDEKRKKIFDDFFEKVEKNYKIQKNVKLIE